MVILGIDPGLKHTGWAIVEACGSVCQARAYGCIDTVARESTATRLATIHDALREVIERYAVQEAAIEDIYFGANARSAFALGQARGAAILACADLREVAEYPPATIKSAIVGGGNATKEQVGYMVQMALGLDHVPTPDHCSDACAVALTHLYMRTKSERIGRAERRACA
ncbi:MAG: crossover junction endodeoxyribonuclease RuvC [Coriobacteriia bacterium]|nr:crossover junction endodeoxyribonuclease RuvC [Coriobacteriia bacterium]